MISSRLRLVEMETWTPTVDWLEEHVYLAPRVPTARAGQWRRDNVAALARPGGPLEALDDPACETIVVAKGSQTGMTTTAYCWLAHCLVEDPSSALIVMNSTNDARDKAAESFRPLFEDSPKLRRYLPRSRQRDWARTYQNINGAPVFWAGANSPGRLGAKPVRRLILDEVDKYPERFGGKDRREAGAAALAEQRTKTFKQAGVAKILKFSTPTTDTGEVWRSFEQGDQRKFWVRCHACQEWQVMQWRDFRIDVNLAKTKPAKAVDDAHYECPHCKARWSDGQRYAAVDGGEWRPSAEARDPRCRSFHLPSWLSKLIEHRYLASKWLQALEQGGGALQDFINSECGEPFKHYETRVRDEQFATLEGAYSEGELWSGVAPYAEQYAGKARYVFGGVDVQKNYLMVVFREFIEGGDSGLVWSGDVSGFEALDDLAARFGAAFTLIDQRYRSREVQEWCASHRGYIPAQGVNTRAKSIFTISALNLDEGKRGAGGRGRVIEVVNHDADQLKDLLVAQMQGGQGARRWLVPHGYASNAKYVSQMTVERCVNGRWTNPSQRDNHFFDAEVLCLLAAVRFGVWAAASEAAVEPAPQVPGGFEKADGSKAWEVRKL